jgi:hypothetical protein
VTPFQSFASLVSNLTELEIFLEIDVFVCLNLKNMNVNAMKDQQPVFASESFSFVLVSKFSVNKNPTLLANGNLSVLK